MNAWAACAGVRYPAHLLHLVVATLSSIQTLMPPQAQMRQPADGATFTNPAALQEDALKAAAMGAGGALRTEPVSPIDKRSLSKALRFAACCMLARTCACEADNQLLVSSVHCSSAQAPFTPVTGSMSYGSVHVIGTPCLQVSYMGGSQ